MRKGQVINIDWTVGLALFLISSLTAVIFLTNINLGPNIINSLDSKTLEVQTNLEDLTRVEARKVPLIIRGPEEISNIPVDRYYNFPSNAYPDSGGGDISAELDIKRNNIVAVTDSGNLTHSMVYFTESVSNASYSNDIETDSNWINNSKISMRKDSSGINSLKIFGQELLNPDADLGAGDSSINESGIYAETLSGNLRAYKNSSELIIDDRSGNLTFNLENLSTVYWYENDTAISLTGTGVKAEGNTKGFSIASDYGITFIGDMNATVSKPDTSTVKAEIDAEKIRVRLHNSDYKTGKKRIRFYDKGYIVLGTSKKFSAPYSSKIQKLNSESENDFKNSLNLQNFGYNIGLGSWIQKIVENIQDWNRNGDFNATSASRKDNSGTLGIGYLNGTKSGQPQSTGLNNESLVGYWRMDRDVASLSGDTAIDYSGEGNDGTLGTSTVGDASEPTTGTTGIMSTDAMDFDGSDDYVETGTTGFDSPTFTASVWAKGPGTSQDTTRIINYGDSTANNGGFIIGEDSNGQVRAYVMNDNGNWISFFSGTGLIDDGKWHHLVITYNGTTAKLFVDANQKNSPDTSYDETPPNPTFTIGREAQGGEVWEGSIDEVRIYNRSLSPSEVEDLYFQGMDGKFNGDYTIENQTGSFQKWEELTVDAVIPSGTNLEAVFESLDESGEVVDNQTIQIQEGKNSYSLNSESSYGYRLKFIGDSNDPGKSWEVKDYSLKYGPELKRGSIIPLDTSAVVSNRPSALIHRNGSFSEIQNRVVLWP